MGWVPSGATGRLHSGFFKICWWSTCPGLWLLHSSLSLPLRFFLPARHLSFCLFLRYLSLPSGTLSNPTISLAFPLLGSLVFGCSRARPWDAVGRGGYFLRRFFQLARGSCMRLFLTSLTQSPSKLFWLNPRSVHKELLSFSSLLAASHPVEVIFSSFQSPGSQPYLPRMSFYTAARASSDTSVGSRFSFFSSAMLFLQCIILLTDKYLLFTLYCIVTGTGRVRAHALFYAEQKGQCLVHC